MVGLINLDDTKSDIIEAHWSIIDNYIIYIENFIDYNKNNYNSSITYYNLDKEPQISIKDYCYRLYKYGCFSISCFIYSLCLLDKLLCNNDIYIIKTTIHRIIFILIYLSAKMLEDETRSIYDWAKLGGITKVDLYNMEILTLKNLDYRLHITKEEYDNKLSKLIHLSKI